TTHSSCSFFNATATTQIYTLSLHDALPICPGGLTPFPSHVLVEPQAQEFHFHLLDLVALRCRDGGKEPTCGVECAVGIVTREGRSEEHTSELQSLRHLVCRLLLEKNKTPQQ